MSKPRETLLEPLIRNNPIYCQVLGLCSALAVTGRVETTMVMCVALLITTAGSSLFVSLLRTYTPTSIRMIAEVAIISTFVIMFDLTLKAYNYEMSKQLGPYVGLIITNCIVMGRAEAFALQNRPLLSMVDGIGNGLGYSFVLLAIAMARELFGNGSLWGVRVMPDAYVNNNLMVVAPGAFIMLGVFVWVIRWIFPEDEEM